MNEMKNRWADINNRVIAASKKVGRNPDTITVLAVSKTHPVELIIDAIQIGISSFGENYAQEIKDKIDYFKNHNLKQPDWHFIGHLQSNKVKYIAEFVDTIHSVDSLNLAEEISKQAKKFNKTINILLQANTSGEDSKSGCQPQELSTLFSQIKALDNINIIGLMTIGTFTDDKILQRKEFRLLHKLFDEINTSFPEANLKHLSMGMTGDFETAIEEGATIVRVGTAIFGNRNYY